MSFHLLDASARSWMPFTRLMPGSIIMKNGPRADLVGILDLHAGQVAPLLADEVDSIVQGHACGWEHLVVMLSWHMNSAGLCLQHAFKGERLKPINMFK